jgi:hypothetical protein
MPAAPAPITTRSVSLSHWRSVDKGMQSRLYLAQAYKSRSKSRMQTPPAKT